MKPKTQDRSHGPHRRPHRALSTPAHVARHPALPPWEPGTKPLPWPLQRARLQHLWPQTGIRTQVNPCPSDQGLTSLTLSPFSSSSAARGRPRNPAGHSTLLPPAYRMSPRPTSSLRAPPLPVLPHRHLARVPHHCRYPRHRSLPCLTSPRPPAPHRCPLQPHHRCISEAVRATSLARHARPPPWSNGAPTGQTLPQAPNALSAQHSLLFASITQRVTAASHNSAHPAFPNVRRVPLPPHSTLQPLHLAYRTYTQTSTWSRPLRPRLLLPRPRLLPMFPPPTPSPPGPAMIWHACYSHASKPCRRSHP